jgi:thiamine transport system permease protein
VALAALPVVFLGVFFVWPVSSLLGEVITGSATARILRRGDLWSVVWFTCWQAAISTAATLVAGLGPAYLLARWRFPGHRVLSAVVTVPFLLPTVVVGAAFTTLLPDRMLGTALAVIIAHVFFNVAVVVRVVGTVWGQLPPELIDAARVLGASPWRATRMVTFPILRPAIVAAATIVFLFTFTSFGVVQILGGPRNPTMEVEIARRATQLGDIGGAAVLSVLQLVMLATAVALAGRLAPTTVRVSLVDHPHPSRRGSSPTRHSRRTRAVVRLAAACTAIAMAAPLLALAVSSLRPAGRWSMTAWRTLFDQQAIRPGVSLGIDPAAAITASLRYAVVATAISVTVGAVASLAIASARRRGRLLDVGLMLPLATSAVTIGFGMLITFDTGPVDWRDDWWIVPIGHALVAVPFVVRTTLPVLRARPVAWLDAAATLGASPTRAWWEIDVRRLRRPLVAGAGFSLAVSLGEFGATSVLSRTGDATLPLAIGQLLGRAGDIPRAQASALAVVLAVVTVSILVLVDVITEDAGS